MGLLKKFYYEEDGMGTVEIIMIIAALMCIALLFREQIFQFVRDIMEKIFKPDVVNTPSANNQ